MNGPILPPCAACGALSVGEYEKSGTYLCDRHIKEWTKREALIENLNFSIARWAKAHGLSEVETERVCSEAFGVEPSKLVRSKDDGEDHEAGYKRPFTVVPEDSLEQVVRDVTVTVENLPIWGVEPMFNRIRIEMEDSDFGMVKATLEVECLAIDEAQYEKLAGLSELLWKEVHLKTTKTRLYPSRRSKANAG